ncbi:DNA-binding protein [Photorhabdus sp. APURE]|uniref:DNA-binding protein n=1 Tax=Photorhabdus aballayi TaxID=2991723 RepID=UPI00223E5251|nr:DNA-binding protein [Photorhabdus aballayi]MCW7549998.1 DNA-binding protein [Photorhabdus aballayi]
MARKLIEYTDVAKAAQKLVDAGKRPTIIAIRALLDKGSYTTISTYLKQWAEENPFEDEPVEVVLPESVVSDAELFLRKIYSVAKARADEQLEREREVLRQREAEFQEDMQQAVDMANEAVERVELLEEQLEELGRKKAETDASLAQTDKSLSLKSSELERLYADAEKQEKRLAELEAKLEGKTAELIRAQDQLEQTKEENTSLSQKLATTEDELTVQKGKNIEQNEKLRSMQEQSTDLKEQLEKTQAKLTENQDFLNAAKAHGDAADRECQRLTTEHEKLEGKLSGTEADIRNLVQEKGVMAGQIQEKNQQAKQLEKKYDDALTKISKLEHEIAKVSEKSKVGKGEEK